MPVGITLYGNSCKTKEAYKNDGYSVIEESDGTVAVYDSFSNPYVTHETKPCCEALGYTFDATTQKCRWALDSDELFKVVLNPEGNSSTLFQVDNNETCSLEVSFDYLFVFECDKLREARAKAVGVTDLATQRQIDTLEAEINNLTVECEFYQDIIDSADVVPYVIQYLGAGVTGPGGTTLPPDPSLYYGGNLPPLSYGEFDPNVVSYCLTQDGLTAWSNIITSDYITWSSSPNYGSDTSYYTNEQVKQLVESETSPGQYVSETCDYSIFDKARAEQTKADNTILLQDCELRKQEKIQKLNIIQPNVTLDVYLDTGICNTYMDMFEQFDTAFTLEVETTGTSTTNKLVSVYEEPLLSIGGGNLYDYINSTSGKTGILISGDTGLMPTLAESNIDVGKSADLCTQVRDVLVTDLFNQYLETNDLPQTQKEQVDIFTELTGWYQSCWLEYNTVITDPDVISAIENEKINITISIKNCCVNFSILLDRIKMKKVCSKVDNVKRFISEPPKFELTKVCDNKKSWIANTEADERFFDLKYRGTEYDTNHHRLVVNTKEVDLNLSPSRAVEQDVWCYINDNNCILEGCLSSGETFNGFSCPSGYTLDVDGNSCTEETLTGATIAATTYTVGPGVGLTRPVHYLSRGVIFVEDITDNEWPIYWTGTTNNSWVGPYYNSDFLTDSSGKYLEHTGFGTNSYSDGTLQYASPEAFSGIKSRFGKSNSDIVAAEFNPNILWGGTDGSVSASSYNNLTSTDNAGRLLNASVWTNPGTLPIQEWIGLAYTLNLTKSKTYRLGFAADDNVRIKINGEYLINPVTTPVYDPSIHNSFSISYSRTIQAYVVMGITLSAGRNIIEVEGYNDVSGMAGFVLELYDATEAQLKNMRFESELDSVRVFSTLDRVGANMDLGENSGKSCPAGYSLISFNCIKINKITRQEEQLDEYCPCPDFPLIVNDYNNVTLELPLTASTTSFDCSDITALVLNFPTTTTIEPIDVIKGGRVFSMGQKTPTYFSDYWFSEENDGTLGVYKVLWNPGGGVSTQDNVSDQVDAACCQVIDDAFQEYADLNNQGINNYPSVTWDKNKNKCVYTKCGDSGCNNLDEELTTELSQIDTVKEFTSVLTSELIDVKSRQTLSSYPTLRMLYDRYNTRSEEFCGIDSSKYDYSDMDKFGQTVGDYWVDLIEQVVPATTIWGSTYAYKNTVFDQQKFNYRSNNIYFSDINPVPAVTLKPFDFLVLEYEWDQAIGGGDLDTRTSLDGTGDPWTGVAGSPTGPDGNDVGYQRGATYTGGRKYVGDISDPYMIWGGDCISNCSSEQVLINFKKLANDYTSINEFLADIKAFWFSGGPTATNGLTGEIKVNMTTYLGGIMTPSGLGFSNTGGAVVDNSTFNTTVTSSGGGAANNGEILGQIKYDKTTKKAVLIDANAPISTPTTISSSPTTTTTSPAPIPLAIDPTVSVIRETLPNPNPGTGSTVTLQPVITRSNGVWIKDNGCDSDFLGTVKTVDKNGVIIPS